MRSTASTRSSSCGSEFGEEEVGDLISQLQELEVIEDAADDDLVPAAELARFDRQLRYFSDIGTGDPTPSECPAAAARGEGRGARGRRAGRLGRPLAGQRRGR